MPTYTVPISGPNGPGYITVNASNPASAIENASQGGDHATGEPIAGGPGNIGSGGGGGTPSAGTPSSPGGATPTQQGSSNSLAQLGAQVNSLLGAIASGNKQAFDEAVRQFNLSFGLDKDKFAESVRQFNENFNIAQSGVTGMYQGAPTQQGILQAGNLAAQQAGLTGYYLAPTAFGAAGQYGLGVAAPTTAGTAGGPGVGAAGNPNLNGLAPGTFVKGVGSNGVGQIQADGTIRMFPDPASYIAAGGNPQFSGITTIPDAQMAAIQGWTPSPPAAAPAAPAAGTPAAAPAGAPANPLGIPTMAREQQTYSQQLGLVNTAAALQANPFRQQQAIGQMQRLLGGQSVAGFSAPQTVAGVGTAGGNTQGGMGYLQQMIDDIQNPAANQHTMQQVMDGIPTPNKLDSVQFFKSPTSTQNLVLQGMQEKYGIDPNDAVAQIKNTMPGFQAPSTFGTVRRPTF